MKLLGRLWTFKLMMCNILPPRGRAPLYMVAYLGHRLPSQTNTSLFCILCPHSCAPGNHFPAGHPSPNCSGLNTLNLGVLWRLASGKEVATCWYEYPINPIKPWAGVSHLPPRHEGQLLSGLIVDRILPRYTGQPHAPHPRRARLPH